MTASNHLIDTAPHHGFEELALRESDGIRVSLLWCRADDGLKVVVTDAGADTEFELEVGDAPALDVFNHPYAYQAHRESTLDAMPRDFAPAVG
jgi:hypothetical protein